MECQAQGKCLNRSPFKGFASLKGKLPNPRTTCPLKSPKTFPFLSKESSGSRPKIPCWSSVLKETVFCSGKHIAPQSDHTVLDWAQILLWQQYGNLGEGEDLGSSSHYCKHDSDVTFHAVMQCDLDMTPDVGCIFYGAKSHQNRKVA